MDTWNEQQLGPMKFGGNKPARDWFEKYGLVGIKNLTSKYGTSAALAYKDKLKTIATGGTWRDLTDEEMQRKYKAISTFGFGGFSTSSPGNFFESEDKDGRATRNRRGGSANASPAVRPAAAKSPAMRPSAPAKKVGIDYDEFFDFGSSPAQSPSTAKNVTPTVEDNEDDIWGFTVTYSKEQKPTQETEQQTEENDEVKENQTEEAKAENGAEENQSTTEQNSQPEETTTTETNNEADSA